MRRSMAIPVAILLLCAILMPGVSAQTPEASPAASPVASAGSDWRVVDRREIELDGMPRSLSPDGQWIAGTDMVREAVCVWDVQTLTPTCAGDDLQISPGYFRSGFAWAPDSSAVAFLDGAAALGESDAVMLFDITSGTLSTLTRSNSDPVEPDWFFGLAWTNDSQRIVIGRVGGSTAEPLVVDPHGGASYTIPLPDWSVDGLVVGPFDMTPHGELIINVSVADRQPNGIEGMWIVSLDGSNPVRVLEDGASYPLSRLATIDLSANGRYVSMYSLDAVARMDWAHAFHLADLHTGEIKPVEIDGSRYVLGPPLFSPSGTQALLQGGLDLGVILYVYDLETGEASPVGGSSDALFFNWFRRPPTWAKNDTIFVPSDEGGMLLTLEHDE